MKRIALLLVFVVLAVPLYAAEGEPGGDILRDFVFIDYVKGDTIGGSDQTFFLTPKSELLDLKGNALKNSKEIPVPCLAYLEFDNNLRINFMRIVKIYKPVMRNNQPIISTGREISTDYEVVDSLVFKNIEDLKKKERTTIPVIKSTMPDTILKIKPLPR